jgi:hypothetical protein
MSQTIIGGSLGYWSRRIIHIAIGFIPILYYWEKTPVENFFLLSLEQIISIIVVLIITLDIARQKRGWLIFGQRHYEAKQFSALAWTTFAVGLVLLSAPKIGVNDAGVGAPIIWALCLTDPLMGEFRKKKFSKAIILLSGSLVVTSIWLISVIWLATPWWFIIFLVPVTVMAEWFKIPGIDDNAVILLLPLAVIFFLLPWQ